MLCCSLDSLILLDVLLEHCPSLVASVAERLLPNLVRLIAQPRQSTSASSDQHSRQSTMTSLIVNPNSRMSTQKWRVRVLRRLAAFFDAVVAHTQQCVTDATTLSSSSSVVVATDSATIHHCITSRRRVTSSSLHHFTLRSPCP